ncbi:MAG: hypothetical protein MJ237_02540 [bacterium]|nr:hypothetical protein [bacterium]
MQINKINNISFRENTLSMEMQSNDAILMLRDQNALVKFKRNQELASKADSINANPIVAIGYKLYRTFSLIANDRNSQSAETALNAVA